MTLFDKHALPPQELKLPSCTVKVQKFSWQFRRWTGAEPERTHGPKPYVEWEGQPTFAEIALISVLKQHGFTGAVWRDNWGAYRCFHDAMPPAKCEEPEAVREVCNRIRGYNRGRWGGCWDVLAWNQDGVTFIECKHGTDKITGGQIRWLDSGLKSGLSLDNFAICEWTFAA